MKLNKRIIFIIISAGILFFIPISTSSAQKSIWDKKKDEGPVEKSIHAPAATDVPSDTVKVLTSPSQIRTSEEYGSVKETWTPKVKVTGDGDPVIIHIQDAHCHYEAQTNINHIIDNLMKEYPDQIKLIAVEGSVGLIDTSPFAEFSDAEIKREVADYFMQKGKITGPEFLSITGPYKFTIYGIENKELYDRNYKAFLDSLPFREESETYCSHLADILDQLKRHIYSDELKEFDKSLKEYQDGTMSFLDYADMLEKWAEKKKVDVSKFKDFALLQEAQEAEKGIDFNMVDKERTRLIDKLGSVLDKQELSDLVMKSLHFRLGKISASEYYSYLKDLVDKVSQAKKISWGDYPNLYAYIDYVQLHSQMDKSKLFEECSEIENLVAEAMFKNDDQRQLFQLSKNVDILRRMFKLELVKEDYLYYKAHKDKFRAASFISFINVQAPRYRIDFKEEPGLSKIDENLSIIEEFYEVAIIRDPVLIDNMLAEMEREGVNISVLITGGFHTKGITGILQERNLPYIVISPKITKQQEYNPYIDIMTNKKTPFEEFLEQLEE